MKHRLIVAEDHTLLRQGLSAMLSREADYEVVAQVADGREAVRAVAAHAPAVVLLNLSLPGLGGVETTQQIKRRDPAVRVLGLAGYSNDEYIRAALRAGVDGYLLRDTSFEDLMVALRNVIGGRKFLSPEVSTQLVETFLNGADARSPWDTLTPRERSILKLVAEGHTNRSSAEFLSVSPKTVEKHRASLMRKLRLRNATELVLMAVDMGLIERPELAHTYPRQGAGGPGAGSPDRANA